MNSILLFALILLMLQVAFCDSIKSLVEVQAPLPDGVTVARNFGANWTRSWLFCSKKRKPGFYANVDAGCRSYFICSSERGDIEMECPEGHIFDQRACECHSGTVNQKLNCCADVSEVNECPPKVSPAVSSKNSRRKQDPKWQICMKKGEGWFPDFSFRCQNFFHCKHRNDRAPVVLSCPKGMTFSSDACACVDDAAATCDPNAPFDPCHIPEFDGCRHLAPGFYASRMHNCERYFICSLLSDETYFFDCPTGQKFNVKTCTCEPQANVECYRCSTMRACHGNETTPAPYTTPSPTVAPSTTTPPTEAPSTLTLLPVTPPPDSCSGKSTGLYPLHDSDCWCYYGCVQGIDQPLNYVCPPYFRFDIRTCSCQPLQWASCQPFDEHHGCVPKPPPTTTTVAPPTTIKSKFCTGRASGYYADVNRQCEWFFVCDGRSIATTQVHCPADLRFNRWTCQCDYPGAVPCTVFDEGPCQPKTTSTTAAIVSLAHTTPRSDPEFFCEGKDPGFYINDVNNCSCYILCFRDDPNPYELGCHRH